MRLLQVSEQIVVSSVTPSALLAFEVSFDIVMTQFVTIQAISKLERCVTCTAFEGLLMPIAVTAGRLRTVDTKASLLKYSRRISSGKKGLLAVIVIALEQLTRL